VIYTISDEGAAHVELTPNGSLCEKVPPLHSRFSASTCLAASSSHIVAGADSGMVRVWTVGHSERLTYCCAMQVLEEPVKRVLVVSDPRAHAWVCGSRTIKRVLLPLSKRDHGGQSSENGGEEDEATRAGHVLPEPLLDACVWNSSVVFTTFSGTLSLLPGHPRAIIHAAPLPGGRKAYCIAALGQRLVCGCTNGEILTWVGSPASGCGVAAPLSTWRRENATRNAPAAAMESGADEGAPAAGGATAGAESVGDLCVAVAATEVLVAAVFASGPLALYAAVGLELTLIAFFRRAIPPTLHSGLQSGPATPFAVVAASPQSGPASQAIEHTASHSEQPSGGAGSEMRARSRARRGVVDSSSEDDDARSPMDHCVADIRAHGSSEPMATDAAVPFSPHPMHHGTAYRPLKFGEAAHTIVFLERGGLLAAGEQCIVYWT
jgi:hypothetical protein